MTSDRADVLILGAGIAGCALAHHLAARRVSPVAVYDPATPAAGATGRAAGIVTEQLWDRWDVEVTRDAKREYAALAARWDPAAYTVNGFVRWTRDETVATALEDAAARLGRWGVRSDPIDPASLAGQLPTGRFDDVRAAFGSRDDAVVTPSSMTEMYAESARHAGVVFRLGTPLRRLAREGTAWELDLGAAGAMRAERLVIAAGAWSKRLLAEVGHPLPLAPYRTQAAVLRPPESAAAAPPFPSAHDLDLDVYVRPESNGRILAGDGTELVEVDPDRYSTSGDERFVTRLAETFATRFPGWADAELVRAWAGVCTATPDRRPLVGPVAGAHGLFVLTGFNGFGVMRAGGVAPRLADLLAAGEAADGPTERLRPVLPERFAGVAEPFPIRPGFTLEGGDAPRF